MLITGSLIASVVPGIIGKAISAWTQSKQNTFTLARDRLRYQHHEKVADYEYRKGRNQQIAAIQGKEPAWSHAVRMALAAPVIFTYWFIFILFWLTGEWFSLDGMPGLVEHLFYANLSFWFMYEVTNGDQRNMIRRAIISDPKHEATIEAAGQRRRRVYKRRHGPRGQ